jgi:SMC interacting uncharacterized protein involved in chromosome segregation
MSDEKEHIDDIVENLKQIRDELEVKIHLGKAEAKKEWDRLEKKWQELKGQSQAVAGTTSESLKNVGSALELVAEELKDGYKRIRKLL